jgi:hypothetical protein
MASSSSDFMRAYRSSVGELGNWPDKYTIQRLTQQAGRHQQPYAQRCVC